MNKAILNIPYGKGRLRFSLPCHRLLGSLAGSSGKGKRDLRAMLAGSLDKMPNADRLRALASEAGKILIVVPDATRSAHLKVILPELFKRISKGPRSSIDIIVATGLHKEHTGAQLKDLLGDTIVRRHRILSHLPSGERLMKMGRTKKGVPIVLDKILKRYGLVISLGVIEPHLYAGYSGGIKTIAIGLAGEETINATHSIRFLGDPGTKLGSIIGNPFQDTLWEIAEDIKAGLAINVVNDADGGALAVFSGNIRDVFLNGVKFCKDIFEVSADRPADIVICGVGYPKDINLYQASRAINYILNVDRPVLKKGGVLIVAAALREGIGKGLSEKRFYNEMMKMKSPAGFLAAISRKGFLAGAHRAYMVAGPMIDYKIVFVVKDGLRIMRGLPFSCFTNIPDALTFADGIAGKDSKIYVIPRALATIARVS